MVASNRSMATYEANYSIVSGFWDLKSQDTCWANGDWNTTTDARTAESVIDPQQPLLAVCQEHWIQPTGCFRGLGMLALRPGLRSCLRLSLRLNHL